MLRISRRISHFVFAIIQSGLTRAIAAAIDSYPFLTEASFTVVVFAEPGIRKLAYFPTRDEGR
jgi:hypothetical protein